MAEGAPTAFVCGHPVAHSRSPLIHRHWLKTHELAGAYEAIDVTPADFGAFLRGYGDRGYRGGNITIPHKEAAFALADVVGEAAAEIGAVNTVWTEAGRLVADNTDWTGFAANLDDLVPSWRGRDTALVLGAGGASRAVIFALLRAGYSEVRVVNRTVVRAVELADRFGPRVTAHDWNALGEMMADADLLVNTTSLGMDGAGSVVPDVSALPATAIVTDIVYVPLETPILAAARMRGLQTADGLGMLLHQAAPGFARWFGTVPQVDDALRQLVIADMAMHA